VIQAPRGWNRWLGVIQVLAVVGLVLLALSIPQLSSRVVAHEVVVFEDGPNPWDDLPVVLGPYHLEPGHYAVWIEDHFPGFDDGDMYQMEVYNDDGAFIDTWYFGNYETRTINGVDCEHTAGVDHVPEGEWFFEITLYGNDTDDPLHLFIVREYEYLSCGSSERS
jgi:hypothetical protein